MLEHFRYNSHRTEVKAVLILLSFAGLSAHAQAIPATADTELAALRVSESDMETDLAAEDLYQRLKAAAQKACDSGVFPFNDEPRETHSTCAIDTVRYFIDLIGNEKLKAISERDTRPTPYQKLSNLTKI